MAVELSKREAGMAFDRSLHERWGLAGEWSNTPASDHYSRDLNAAFRLMRHLHDLGLTYRFCWLLGQVFGENRWWPDLMFDLEAVHIARAAETLWVERQQEQAEGTASRA